MRFSHFFFPFIPSIATSLQRIGREALGDLVKSFSVVTNALAPKDLHLSAKASNPTGEAGAWSARIHSATTFAPSDATIFRKEAGLAIQQKRPTFHSRMAAISPPFSSQMRCKERRKSRSFTKRASA